MADEIRIPKKLIEVALPLDMINKAAAREKSIRHGHPSTLHLWWARRPLAAARAVIFAQMVNDPGYERSLQRGVNREKAAKERERLFKIIEELVKWENINNADLLEQAKAEIWKSWRETCALNSKNSLADELFNPNVLPGFHDPFAGGGAIPLEAQRLGLNVSAADLNPVAVTINKALLEVPQRFVGKAPVGSNQSVNQSEMIVEWKGAAGLAEDVCRYGAWIRKRALKLLGDLYPRVVVSKNDISQNPNLSAYRDQELKVIAWIWSRTVKSPSPAFSHVDVPLCSSFVLSSKQGQEAYIQPVISGDQYTFEVRYGIPPDAAKEGTKLGRGANFKCILSGSPISAEHIKCEGEGKRIGTKLIAIVAEGKRGRIFLSPTDQHDEIAKNVKPSWVPPNEFAKNSRHMTPWSYGMTTFGDLFTGRQLKSLDTISLLINEAFEECHRDAINSGFPDDQQSLEDGGAGALAYAQAVQVYLSLGLSKLADSQNSLVTWKPSMNQAIHLFTKQAIPMVWDFAEPNLFSEGMGDYNITLSNIARTISNLMPVAHATVLREDAVVQKSSNFKIVSTDPPYYDNVPYADLSDFFYIWMKRGMEDIYPSLFACDSVDKENELVADAFRMKGKVAAENFFFERMKKALVQLSKCSHPGFPLSIYYAFKQTERSSDGVSSKGWETFLQAIIDSGFAISGTWPMRTELGNRTRGIGSNALASSVLLVCKNRTDHAKTVSRRDFIRELNIVMPEAILEMTSGGVNSPVAPVDLSQAVIGPGMAVFSKYQSVLEADGTPMSVRTALTLINRFISEEDLDCDTQFCVHWFESYGWDKGLFGEADVLARAKGTSVEGLKEAGVVSSSGGSLRLYRWNELPSGWRPETDTRLSIWELLHHMIRVLNSDGESGAGTLLAKAHQYTDTIRSLAYRLYTLCERKGWAKDAGFYNGLVVVWEQIEKEAQNQGHSGSQISLFGLEGRDAK